MDLLELGGAGLPKVSVVVPNYNYAHYLRDRLHSVAGQDVPLYEIIVLDDASRDDSLAVLQDLRGELRPEPIVVPSRHQQRIRVSTWLREWSVHAVSMSGSRRPTTSPSPGCCRTSCA